MACCGKSEIDSNDVKTNDFTKHYQKLKHSDKVALIIKIQAFFRGFRARKRIQKIREQTGFHAGMGQFNMHHEGASNYDNPDVIVFFQFILLINYSLANKRAIR
jgi:hypothetical protein